MGIYPRKDPQQADRTDKSPRSEGRNGKQKEPGASVEFRRAGHEEGDGDAPREEEASKASKAGRKAGFVRAVDSLTVLSLLRRLVFHRRGVWG